MSEHPIIFSTPMVRAILDGRKTQTRRVIKPQPYGWLLPPLKWRPGDLLWVRETWCPMQDIEECAKAGEPIEVHYKADYEAEGIGADEAKEIGVVWRSSRFMPKWAARLWLKVVDVRVERVQEIKEEDAIAEGMVAEGETSPPAGSIGLPDKIKTARFPVGQFAALWDSLNAKRVRPPIDKNIKEGMSQGDSYGWDENPWVWVVEFKRIEK